MKSLFEQNGGTYHKENDYFISNLVYPYAEEMNIGIY